MNFQNPVRGLNEFVELESGIETGENLLINFECIWHWGNKTGP